MSQFQLRAWIAGIVVFALFVGAVIYAGQAGPRMTRGAGRVLNSFYTRLQKRDYAGAHALLTPSLRAGISPADLRATGAKFEQRHGPIKKWEVAPAGMGNSQIANVFPPFVDFTLRVEGARGGSNAFFSRLVPDGGTWRIEQFREFRSFEPPQRRGTQKSLE